MWQSQGRQKKPQNGPLFFQCFQQFKEKQWPSLLRHNVPILYNSYNHSPFSRPALVAESLTKFKNKKIMERAATCESTDWLSAMQNGQGGAEIFSTLLD